MRLFNRAQNIFVFDDRLYYYFIHDMNTSRLYKAGYYNEWLKAYDFFVKESDNINNKTALIYRLLFNLSTSIISENLDVRQSFTDKYKTTKRIVKETFKFKEFIPSEPKKYINSERELIIFYLAKHNCVLLIVIFMQLLKYKNFCKKMLKKIFK